MAFPTPPFEDPVTCKELAYYIPGRSARWVARECRERRILTLPIGKPYLIPPHEANRILQIEIKTNERSHSNRSASGTR